MGSSSKKPRAMRSKRSGRKKQEILKSNQAIIKKLMKEATA
jgi:hypothetical protein